MWGDYAHYGGATANRSPDHAGLVSMAEAATLFAGTGQRNNRGRRYPHQPMSAGVYPVHGGMEDWAYAASWDAPRLSGCTPSTHGGYRPERTAAYENASARAVVAMLYFNSSYFLLPTSYSLITTYHSGLPGGDD